jgi:uncharacterized protein with FMN-binding domain
MCPMKRNLALAGLVFVGLMLFFTPNTGVVAVAQQALLSPDVTTTTTITAAPPDPGTTTTTSGTPPDTTGSADTTTTEATTTTTQPPSQAVTVVGDRISSPYGPFQVQITVENGTITDITTLEYPQDRRSQYINQQVLPYYTTAALDAQSTDFSGISGATITWRSWRASLDSAIQAAGI